jgi:hypothetical protein
MKDKQVEIVLAPGPNALAMSPDEKGKAAGFWRGLLHGSIAPITFVISLFNHNVHMYEVHNNGGWYNFGYLLGLSVIFGGGHRGASQPHSHRRPVADQPSVGPLPSGVQESREEQEQA